MMVASLKLQETRDLNYYRRYRHWYAQEHPMAPGR